MFGLFRKDNDLELLGSNTKIKSESTSSIEAPNIKLRGLTTIQGPATLEDTLSVLGSSHFSKSVSIKKSRDDNFGLSVNSILTDKLTIGTIGDTLSIHKGYLNTGENLFESSELSKTARAAYPLYTYKNGVFKNEVLNTITIKDISILGDTLNVNLGYDTENPWWLYFNFQPSHWVSKSREIAGSLSLSVVLRRKEGNINEQVGLKTFPLLVTHGYLDYGKGYTDENLIFAAKCNISEEYDIFSFTGLTSGNYELDLRFNFSATTSNYGAFHAVDFLGYFGIITEKDLKERLYDNSSKYVYPTDKEGTSIVSKSGSEYSWGAPNKFIAFCNNNIFKSNPIIAVLTYEGSKASSGSSIAVITPRGFIFGADADNYVRLCLGQDPDQSLGTKGEDYSFKFKRAGKFVDKFDVPS